MRLLHFRRLALLRRRAPRLSAAVAAESYAWVSFDRDGDIGSVRTALRIRARRRPLTLTDPVRIASISKLAVALGVIRLVEQGRLDLNRDVSAWLGWRLRNPAFPDRADHASAAALAPLQPGR